MRLSDGILAELRSYFSYRRDSGCARMLLSYIQEQGEALTEMTQRARAAEEERDRLREAVQEALAMLPYKGLPDLPELRAALNALEVTP